MHDSQFPGLLHDPTKNSFQFLLARHQKLNILSNIMLKKIGWLGLYKELQNISASLIRSCFIKLCSLLGQYQVMLAP